MTRGSQLKNKRDEDHDDEGDADGDEQRDSVNESRPQRLLLNLFDCPDVLSFFFRKVKIDLAGSASKSDERKGDII